MLELTGQTCGVIVGIIPGIPGYVEVIIVVVVILLLFGGKKLPELARGLARGMRIFKHELKGIKTEIEEDVDEPPARDEKAENHPD